MSTAAQAWRWHGDPDADGLQGYVVAAKRAWADVLEQLKACPIEHC